MTNRKRRQSRKAGRAANKHKDRANRTVRERGSEERQQRYVAEMIARRMPNGRAEHPRQMLFAYWQARRCEWDMAREMEPAWPWWIDLHPEERRQLVHLSMQPDTEAEAIRIFRKRERQKKTRIATVTVYGNAA